ncbi:MAG: CBS domain-containing protein [Gammaproteobacteria bacterium]|nr:CBS domain-containing protein [Gammaproteobacteria bacterium]
MTARLVMDPHPSVMRADETVAKAIEIIMQHRYRSLPVVDEDGCYLGVFGVNVLLKMVLPPAVILEKGLTTAPFVTDDLHDLRRRLAGVEQQPVRAFMNDEAVAVNPDTPLVETLLVLYRTRASVPVVEPGTCRLVGMISYWDVGRRILEQED